MINTCRALIIHGLDAKNILSSVFKRMGVVGVIVSDNMIKHLVLDYSCHRAEFSIEADFPAYLISFNKKTGKTCFILTYHPQIGSSLVRPDISKYEFKFWARVIHLLVSIFLKITGAKCCQEFFPDFMTVDDVDVIYSQHKDRQLRSHGVASQIRPIIEYGHLQSTTPDWW